MRCTTLGCDGVAHLVCVPHYEANPETWQCYRCRGIIPDSDFEYDGAIAYMSFSDDTEERDDESLSVVTVHSNSSGESTSLCSSLEADDDNGPIPMPIISPSRPRRRQQTSDDDLDEMPLSSRRA